jgi:photosystem II stability/assembly factor-like uncharacterized protein
MVFMTYPSSRVTLVAPLLALSLFGAGCFGTSNSAPQGPDGGVWKTTDGGQTWVNKKVLVAGSKAAATVATYEVPYITADPQDHNVLYATTKENGMIFTEDGGDSWRTARTLSTGSIGVVAVDPKHKCTVYASSANKIYKTETCGRDWNQIFFDPRTDKRFTQLIVDWYNPTILYAGTSDGDVFRSRDAGVSWQLSKRVDGISITSIAIHPTDSRMVYAGTKSDGIWKTTDGGETWMQIKKQFGEDYSDARRVYQVVIDPVDPNTIYDVSKYGILKSTDGGDTWKALTLTAPPGTLTINSLVIDPKNNKNLTFTGVSTLQFSTDGGITWTPKKLPTTRTGATLLIDSTNSQVMYLTTVAPPSK